MGHEVEGPFVNWPDPYSSNAWDVRWNPAGWFNGTNFIVEKFNDVDNLITSLLDGEDGLKARIDALSELGNVDLPEGWQDYLDDVIIDPITKVDKGSLPPAPTLTLPDDWPSTDSLPILGQLTDVPNVDLSYTTPVEPPDVNPNLNYKELAYNSSIWDVLFNRIYDNLLNGGTGLDDDARNAIWESMKYRKQQDRATEYQTEIDALSSDGFDFAAGAQADFLARSRARWTFEDDEMNRQIAIKEADMVYQANQFFTDKGIALEDILRKFHNDRENRTLDAEKAIAQFILTKYSEKIKMYIAQWDGVKAKLAAARELVSVVKEQNDLVFGKYTNELEGVKLKTEIVAKKIQGLTDGYRGQVEGFRALVDRESAWWKAQTDEQRNIIARTEVLVNIAVQKIKAILESTMSANGIRSEIAKAVANITSQVLAAALSAINVTLSDQSSSEKSIREDWSHSETLSEDHRL